jgi:hypothetical protein
MAGTNTTNYSSHYEVDYALDSWSVRISVTRRGAACRGRKARREEHSWNGLGRASRAVPSGQSRAGAGGRGETLVACRSVELGP